MGRHAVNFWMHFDEFDPTSFGPLTVERLLEHNVISDSKTILLFIVGPARTPMNI